MQSILTKRKPKRIFIVSCLFCLIIVLVLTVILYVKKESISLAGGPISYASAMYQLNIKDKSMATIYSSDDVPRLVFVVKRGDYQPFIDFMTKNRYLLKKSNGRDLYFSKGKVHDEHYYVRYLTGKYDIINTSFPYDYFK